MNPLGKYSQVVAAAVAIATIFAAIGMHGLGVADAFVDTLAGIAFGAIFGASASAAVTNGALGRDLKALHERFDSVGVAAADLSSREAAR